MQAKSETHTLVGRPGSFKGDVNESALPPPSLETGALSKPPQDCWICFDSTVTRSNPIVANRCRCRGSVGFVHQKCIDKWVIHQRNRVCHSCAAVYQTAHTNYPPGVHYPETLGERLIFLLQHLVRPFLQESAEVFCCVLVRFFLLPLFLGIVYNFHQRPVLLWLWSNTSDDVASAEASFSVEHRDLKAAHGPSVSAMAATVNGVPLTLTASLLAWANTFLFGAVMCILMDRSMDAWERWQQYFRDARARRAPVPAGEGTGGPARVEHLTSGEAPGVRLPEQHAQSASSRDSLNRDPGNALGRAPLKTRSTTDAGNNVDEIPLPDVGPSPVAEQAEEAGHADSSIQHAAISDSDSSSSSENEDDFSEDAHVHRLSYVDELFESIEWIKLVCGGGGIGPLARSLWWQLTSGTALALLLSSMWGRAAVTLGLVIAVLAWRWCFKLNVLANPKRRVEEVEERISLQSHEEERKQFIVFLFEAFCLYILLPLLGGVTLHYAVAPFIDVGFDQGLAEFFFNLTVLKLVLYWSVGVVLALMMTVLEVQVISPLFAYGVDLFFVRSFDVRGDFENGFWRCVINQTFDNDLLSIARAFTQVAVVNLLIMYTFVQLPLWTMTMGRQMVWGDGINASNGLPVKMSLTLGSLNVGTLQEGRSYNDWYRAEILRAFAKEVLIPFETFYGALAHVPLLDVPMENFSLDVAALLPSPSPSGKDLLPPNELWNYSWGNMSERVVFVFDILDPESARTYAETSDGFREKLERLQSPWEWLRMATADEGACTTLMAMRTWKRWDKLDIRHGIHPLRGYPKQLLTSYTSSRSYGAHKDAIFMKGLGDAVKTLSAGSTEVLLKENSSRPTLWREEFKLSTDPHVVSAAKCYIAATQQCLSLLFDGDWWKPVHGRVALQLLAHPSVSYAAGIFFYVTMMVTIACCFVVFPIQLAQLAFLTPIIYSFGRSVLRMGDYLFDPQQELLLQDFLEQNGAMELGVPDGMEKASFSRREDFLPKDSIPSLLLLRRLAMAFILFCTSSVMVWAIPVLWGILIMSFSRNAFPVLLGAVSLSFVCWSPKNFGCSFLLGFFLTLMIVFAIPFMVSYFFWSLLLLLLASRSRLVEETFERVYDVRQTVTLYTEVLKDETGATDK